MRPLVAPRGVAPADSAAAPEFSAVYRDNGTVRDDGDNGDDGLQTLVAAATNGTYNGTVGGKPFTLTVSSNKITSWKVKDLDCPTFTVVEAGATTSCNIAGNDSFTCGGLGCSSFASNMRLGGSFSGTTVTGTFDADFNPFGSCCSFRSLAFVATLSAGGGLPAAPSNLVATAVSDDEVELDWHDNSTNETEFRVEMREGAAGSFTDVGAVGANATGASVTGLDSSTLHNFRVRARNATGNSTYSNIAAATTFGTGPCVRDSDTACLNSGRFEVEVDWQTNQSSGKAQVMNFGGQRTENDESVFWWFFSSTNFEMGVKVLNACSINNKFWVFIGGLTDQGWTVRVRDTQTGATKTYNNAIGHLSSTTADTAALACP